MGSIRKQREEALRKQAERQPSGNGPSEGESAAEKVYAATAREWIKESIHNAGANNSGFSIEKMQTALAATFRTMDDYFDITRFPTPEVAEKLYASGGACVNMMMSKLVKGGIAELDNYTGSLKKPHAGEAYQIFYDIMKGTADALTRRLRKKELSRGENTFQEIQERHADYKRMASNWVGTIAERGINVSGCSPDELKEALYHGLLKTEAVYIQRSEFANDGALQDALFTSMVKLQDHLVALMGHGPDVFVSSYKSLLQEGEGIVEQAAAQGVSTMAHALGIETSLRSEMRRRQMNPGDGAGPRERHR